MDVRGRLLPFLIVSFLLGLTLLASASSAPVNAAVPNATPPNAITVTPVSPTQGEAFGDSLALDGDTLVAGAAFADVGEHKTQGSVVVFARAEDGEWAQVTRLTADDGAAFALFGSAVALDGDTLVVGAPDAEIAGQANQGAAYIFARNQGGANHWGQVKKLVDSEGSALDNYGIAVAVEGNDLFVAASGRGSGVVLRYQRNAGGANQWGQVQKLVDTQGHDNDEYGAALAFDGAILVVGAARSDITGFAENDGAAFVYTFNAMDQAWQETDKLNASDVGDESDSDRFGQAVALYGDVIAVGAPNAEGAGDTLSVGKVYIYERNGDQWPETAIVTASDATQVDNFGETLVAAPQGIIVYSQKGNGTLYTYQPGPAASGQAQTGQAQAGQVQPGQVQEAWHESSRYAAESAFFQSGYGRVLATDGTGLAVGAPELELATGGVYVYALEDVFAPPVVTGPSLAYLPVVERELPTLAVTGELADGGKVMGPDGTGLAAPSGALGAPVNVSLLSAGAPGLSHEDPIVPVGKPYLLGAEIDLSTPITRPLILALPVPTGVDPTHLALAALAPPGSVLDAEDDEPAWLYYEGEYDAPHQRFLTTWPSLTPQGITVELVEDPEFDAPPAGQQTGQPAPALAAAGPQFSVHCLGFYTIGCNRDTEAAVADYLSQIYARMTSPSGFNFLQPRLRDLAESLDFDANSLASLGYSAYIQRKSSHGCKDYGGFYEPSTGRLVLCLEPDGAIDENKLADLIHEYFHATQHAYPAVYQDYRNRKDEQWLIEGMASAAMESYFLDHDLQRIARYIDHAVDIPLTSDTGLIEYSAQDFWVYVGKHLPGTGTNLSYLKHILEHGADVEAVDEGLHDLNTNFKDQMWDWASNQVFEKEEDFDGDLGEACKLETFELQFGVKTWNLVIPPFTSFYPKDGTEEKVAPYTTEVVQMKFPCNSEEDIVGLTYPQCDGLVGGAFQQCYTLAQKDLPSQMYEEGSGTACFDATHGRVLDPELAGVLFEDVRQSRGYYAVVTNVTDSEKSFKMGAELGCSAP